MPQKEKIQDLQNMMLLCPLAPPLIGCPSQTAGDIRVSIALVILLPGSFKCYIMFVRTCLSFVKGRHRWWYKPKLKSVHSYI